MHLTNNTTLISARESYKGKMHIYHPRDRSKSCLVPCISLLVAVHQADNKKLVCTLQLWHIPPLKSGCSRETFRVPQEMQMSMRKEEESKAVCGFSVLMLMYTSGE